MITFFLICLILLAGTNFFAGFMSAKYYYAEKYINEGYNIAMQKGNKNENNRSNNILIKQ